MPKAHEPTRELRAKVSQMVMAGYTQKKIAQELGLECMKTLRKHYRTELDTQHGVMLQDLIEVRNNLFEQAKYGKNPIPAIYVMKAFCDRFDNPVKEEKEVATQQQFGKIEIEVLPGKAPSVNGAHGDKDDEVQH